MGTEDHISLYRNSWNEALRFGETDRWRRSFQENVACKTAIEDLIRRDFDGFHLGSNCVRDVIHDFGFLRTGWVLSATLQQKNQDGRFSPDNKAWAKETYIPADRRNTRYTVESHPAVLDGFIKLFRRELEELQLFTAGSCEPMEGSDLRGKVLVLSPDVLRESCWSPENQLWLAESGFGCRPDAAGRAVYATCLHDGEKARWNRPDFLGSIPEDRLPEWAAVKLEKLRSEERPSAVSDMKMTSI